MSIFKANLYLESIYDLDIDLLKQKGIKYLFLDIDNTLAGYGKKTPDKKMAEFLLSLQQAGFKLFVISNNTRKRVANFCESLKIAHYSMAIKPFSFTYRHIIKKFNLDPLAIACIGDQYFTDVIGAKRLKLIVIFVVPISKHDDIITTMLRPLEKKIFTYQMKHKKIKIGEFNDKV